MLSIAFLPLEFLSGLWKNMVTETKPEASSPCLPDGDSGKMVMGAGFSPSEVEELRAILGDEVVCNIAPYSKPEGLCQDEIVPYWLITNWAAGPDEREQVERWLTRFARRGGPFYFEVVSC